MQKNQENIEKLSCIYPFVFFIIPELIRTYLVSKNNSKYSKNKTICIIKFFHNSQLFMLR